MSSLLGLDIGGTRSRAQLCVDGEVVAYSTAPSASLVAVGQSSAEAALTDLLAALPLEQGHPLDAICVGAAGASVPSARQFLTDHLAPLTRAGALLIVRDAMLVLPAAGLDAGIALICGTGSVAVGSYLGREAQSGGWGYLLGDEGSGYWMVRAALRALLARRDGSAPLGELGDRLLAATGAHHIGALHELFYTRPHPRHWASFAPLVLDSADPAATTIMAEAAAALAGLATSAAERLGAPPALPVVLAGGLFGHTEFEATVRIVIEAARPGSDIRTLTEPPVSGAVRLAQAAASRN
ncbi:MAG TPA: BadF/BadG/BcrA/BcrD ATPase family protein [Streptosporangiaceae bacterium]|jgi:N-acetylglucosamine kinase-like BadF-type ATPase